MGAWGVRLYQSDASLDMRDRFAAWCRIPGTARGLVSAVAGETAAALDRTDDDYAAIWLTLADQLHAHGLRDEETFDRARDIIESGRDEQALLARGISSADAARRRKAMSELVERWSKPHPKPKARKLLKAPEPHAYSAGTIVAYPTCGGEPANYADVSNKLGWFCDGWGSTIILATGHTQGWFAWTIAARLSAHGGNKPSLEDSLAAGIENQPWDMNPSGTGTIAIEIGGLPILHAKRMKFERLGQVDVDPSIAERLCAQIERPALPPFSTIYSVFTWWENGVKPLREMRSEEISVPKAVVQLRQLLRSGS